MITLNQIQQKHKRKIKKIIGKGGKKGRASGRGMKGQKSRTGRKIRPQIRDLLKRIPKLRGYDARLIKRRPVEVVNFNIISKHFKQGDTINKKSLFEKGLIKSQNNIVKVLSNGDLKASFTLEGIKYSKQAKEKLIKSGSKII